MLRAFNYSMFLSEQERVKQDCVVFGVPLRVALPWPLRPVGQRRIRRWHGQPVVGHPFLSYFPLTFLW